MAEHTERGREGGRGRRWRVRKEVAEKRGENRGWGGSEVRGRRKTVGEKGRCFC